MSRRVLMTQMLSARSAFLRPAGQFYRFQRMLTNYYRIPTHSLTNISCSFCNRSSFHTSLNYKSTYNELLTLKNQRVQNYLNHMISDEVESHEEGTMGPESALAAYLKRHIIDLYKAYKKAEQEIKELEQMKEEFKDQLESVCNTEMDELQEQLQEIENQLMSLLVPGERGDDSDIIMEISAGVGGQEAMLFTHDLYNMYKSLCHLNNWEFQPLETDITDMGGIRKASAAISGQDVYKMLKFEGGVHRVQRVPKTEKSGRIHTSTSTVAILPQPTDIDINIKKDDLKWDTFRSSGAGGQHVNKTESAVRVTHTPTGTVVECQIDRSQIKNRDLALKILSSRLYEKQLDEQQNKIRSQRKLQVGSAGRSEKIRTYNYQQDRVTDHRIALNMFGIQTFLSGVNLLEMLEHLSLESSAERLDELLCEFESKSKKIS